MKLKLLITTLALATTLWGCSSTPAGPYGYTAAYMEQRQQCQQSSTPEPEQITQFIRFYNQLKTANIGEQIKRVYAEDVYFNDTLVTFHNRDALTEHMVKTAENVDHLSVTLLDVLHSSADGIGVDSDQPASTYLVWEMEATFSVLGKPRLSHTLGISQLCFNRSGQVNFHQDFWDSSQGLDQHLPLLGPPTRWLRNHSDTH